MARKFCKHYRGMSGKLVCEAGVMFSTLEHYGTKEFHDSCPCFGSDHPGSCELKAYPTKEEMEEENRLMGIRIENLGKARKAIVDSLGGPWKRGVGGSNGVIDCPVCSAVQALNFSRSGYNGHIHASCTTEGCVRWME